MGFRYSNRKLENPVTVSLDKLKEAAGHHDGVIVAYSGGKDSLAVMNLARKIFKNIVGLHWYMFPNLEIDQRNIEYARQRWGVECLSFPDPGLFEAVRFGQYRPQPTDWQTKFPRYDLKDVMNMARHETGFKLVLTGRRETDFNKRKMGLRVGKNTKELHPIAKWSKYDVFAYLKRNDIPIPDQGRKDAGGIDLTAESLLHLHDNHPADFQRLCRYFPFAPAVVKRREFHGIPA